MDDGVAQEVRLTCSADGDLAFEVLAVAEVVSVPIRPCQLDMVFSGEASRIAGFAYQCEMLPHEGAVSLSFEGDSVIRFRLARNQFEALVKSVGAFEREDAPSAVRTTLRG